MPSGNPFRKDALADQELKDHAAIEKTLKELVQRDSDDPQFDELIQSLISEVGEHVKDEEQRLFPMLAEACSAKQPDGLGDKVRTVRKTAPTRPHPSAPDTPPANKLLAPGAGLVDRVSDFVSGRGRS